MSQLLKKFIGNNQVDDTKIRLLNNQFQRGRNAADNGDINIVKVNASNAIEFGAALNLGGFEATNAADPTTAQSLATRAYVLAQVVAASVPSTPVRVAVDFDTSLVAPGTDTFYGVTLVAGDKLLLFGQADNTENGVYVFDTDATPLVRDEAWDAPAEFTAGRLVYAIDGATKFSPAVFALQADAATLGTDPVIFDLVGFDASVLNSSLLPYADNVITLGDATHRFSSAHALTLNSNNVLSDGTTLTIHGLDFGVDILTGNQTSTDPSAPILVKTGDAEDAVSGSITIETGSSDSESGAITIQVGAVSATATVAGTLSILGAQGATGVDGGLVLIQAGAGNASDAGDLQLYGGDASGPGETGSVILKPGTILGGGATQGFIKLQSNTATVGWVFTATNADGSGEWAPPAAGATWEKETFTLNGTDITNQYIDLANVALVDSIDFFVRGGGIQQEGASFDYSVSYTGGAGGNTRITFLNDLATGGPSALIAGDILAIKYQF